MNNSTIPTGSYQDLGCAKVDFSRRERNGLAETIFAPGKTPEQLQTILSAFQERKQPALATRCTQEQFQAVAKSLPVQYDPISRILTSQWECPQESLPRPLPGVIAICSGGTGDMPVAEEAAQCAQFNGCKVKRFYDVGVAGIHRLFHQLDDIKQCQVVIAVAGMEGALASVLAGLVPMPVIAVPTSVGYGANFGGMTALLAMVNSCAEGVTVVNIDNGFGAAMAAYRILKCSK